jgi:CheY-like chemotaxis protein/two-component sensor histidine kinase
MMTRQIQHMARLIEDLLEVSRLTRGKVTLQRARLDLARLVRLEAQDRRDGLEAAGLAVRLEAPETPVWVQGDATRLAQILDNLLDNAAKFTPPGNEVSVRVEAQEGRREAVVVVCDTGVGIDAALLPRVFESFTQADRSPDRSKGGLGLGLALVKGLVELHGGRIEAASEGAGRGACFTIRMPLEDEPAALAERPTAPAEGKKPLRILVVEDNQDSAESLRTLLTLYGYEVTVAHTGPGGVAAALKTRPDVVLCDIGLPGMDGLAVAGALRKSPETAEARLIAVTGYGQEEDRRRALEAGFDEHLVKPVDPDQLLEQLETAQP